MLPVRGVTCQKTSKPNLWNKQMSFLALPVSCLIGTCGHCDGALINGKDMELEIEGMKIEVSKTGYLGTTVT